MLICAVPRAARDEFSLNLNEVDMKALIDTVADITGKNFIVDPRVTGKVTVVTSRPMQAGQIYDIFLSILEVHGFSAAGTGNIVKIIPNTNAKQEYSIGAAGRDGLLTRVIQPHFVDAAEMAQTLAPLMPQHGFISALPGSNAIVLADTAGNVNRLAELIMRMDRGGLHKIELIGLEHASAKDVAETLMRMLNVRHAGKTGGFIPYVGADERTNSVLLAGDEAARREMRALIAGMDGPFDNSGGDTEVIYLRYALAKELAETLTGIKDAKNDKGGQGQNQQATLPSAADIRADEATNAIIITAPEKEMQSFKAVVRQLDIRRAQVHIEAIIAEVNYSKNQEIGVEWHTKQVQDGLSANTFTNNLGDFITNAGKTMSIGYLIGGELRALLAAFAKDNNVNILSTPSLVTLDNEEASMIVGQNIPVVSGSFTTNTSGSTNPFQTVQREDVGVKLKVTPQINEGNAIKLKVKQEVSSVASTDAATGVTINKREIDTSVVVDDGKILVLGGLIQDNVEVTVTKVPVLGDIPYLGHLFQDNNTAVTKRNLLVFLRPVILRDADSAASLSNAKFSDIRNQELRAGRKDLFLMPGEAQPLLPEAPPPVRRHPRPAFRK